MHRRFVPDEVVPGLAQSAVTKFFAVPAVYIGLLNASVPPDAFRTVRYFFSAAATMPVEIAERWRQAHGLAVMEGYGLTETSPIATYNHPWQHRPGSIGTPIENCELRVVDSDNTPLGPGEWGEICMRGPNVMLGYWNQPEETAQALRGGWFYSGDIGYAEKAVLVLDSGSVFDEQELRSFCRERLAAYKVPDRCQVVDELPKNPTGQVLKRVLRDSASGSTSA